MDSLLAPFPTVRAMVFHRYMSTGVTRPTLFQCATDSGDMEDYVVKFRTARYGSTSGCLFEAFAAYLARHFSLPIPPPAIVQFDPALPSALSFEPELRDRLEHDSGFAFGSRLLTGYSTVPLFSSLPTDLRDLAVDVMAFDGLIANFDRSRTNPNILWNDEGFVLIDHELAFRFLDDPLWDAATPWHRRLYYLEDHALFRPLQRSPRGRVDLDRFGSALRALTDERLAEICDRLPVEFGTDRAQEICGYLCRTREEAATFLQAVWGRIR